MLRNILFIPQWIIDTLIANKVDTNKLVSLEEIKDHLSNDDIASIVVLNNYFRELLGFDIGKEIGSPIEVLWSNTKCDETREFINNTIIPLSKMIDANDLMKRFIKEDDDLFNQSEEEILQHLDISPDVSFMIIKPKYFEDDDVTNIQYRLIDDVLQILYVYHPHNVLAKTTLGVKYLELLELYN